MKKLKRITGIGCIVGLCLVAIFSVMDQLGWFKREVKYTTITDSFTVTATPVFKYTMGDKVLLKLGVEAIVVTRALIDEEWKRYYVRVLRTDGHTVQNMEIYEFEIEKKVE